MDVTGNEVNLSRLMCNNLQYVMLFKKQGTKHCVQYDGICVNRLQSLMDADIWIKLGLEKLTRNIKIMGVVNKMRERRCFHFILFQTL